MASRIAPHPPPGFNPRGTGPKPRPKPAAPPLPAHVKNPAGNIVSRVTGGTSVSTPTGNLTLNVRGVQQMLRNAGYNITVDGQLGRQTLQALQNWSMQGGHQLTPAETSALHSLAPGAQLPKPVGVSDWNARFGNSPAKVYPKPTNTNASTLVNGNPNADPSGSVNLTAADQLSNMTGTPLSSSLSQFGTLFTPQDAQAMAGQQYDAQIHDAAINAQRDPVQAATNEQDIKDWYGQAINALKAATGQDTAATNAGVSSVNDAAKAVVASLGGSANPGSADAAVAGQNAANTLQAMGVADTQYQNEAAPILQAEAAQQLTNQKARDTMQQQNDQATLANLEGQKGQALTTDQMQLDSSNATLQQARNAMAMQIAQYNNGLTQQGFQNALGLADAKIAAEMNNVKIQDMLASANYNNARAMHYGTPGAALSPSQLTDVAKNVLSGLTQAGMISGNKLAVSPGIANAMASRIAAGYFQGGQVPGGWVNSVLAPYTPAP
jgi:hypothetical protein